MIYLDYENLGKIDEANGLSPEEISATEKSIKKYLQKIHSKNAGFYECIDDQTQIKAINVFAKKSEGKYTDIVVLGIGGSALGTACLKQCFKKFAIDATKNSDITTPNLHIISNIDPVLIKKFTTILDLSKTLFIVVSKSGTTPETMAQYLYFRQKCKEKKLTIKNHFAFVTDREEGLLREIANKENIPAFEIPRNVGGRFSVLTAAGLLPAKLCGIDIQKMLSGAKKMRDEFVSPEISKNTPFRLAAIQYLLNQKGKNINVLMPYSQQLDRLTDWYTQLLAESIGKQGKGITPLKALGAEDQHSQVQLYNDGPNDKLITFIEVETLSDPLIIPNPHTDIPAFDIINKKVTFNKLMTLEKRGTEMALTENNRPNITIKINNISEETLGELFMMFEGSIAFLGEFFEIYAFDQPAVELGKKFSKELLIKEYS
ncbi:MAG: glucose-6-phosphate isomerase [Candidatus Gracilibacteria bacterium]|nr:glucose-6-phosphate isomerase [Candidatus Gracilibacteria bacterium]